MSPRLLLPITLAVVCAHGLGLWALQSGWEQPAAKAPISNSVTVMTARVEMPQPLPLPQAAAATVVPPAAPAPRDEATAPPRPKSAKPIAHQQAAAEPKAKAVLEPAPVASSSGSSATVEALPAAASSPAPQLIATNAIANASNNPATTQATSPAPNPLELPSSTAAYLNNPPPPYPQLSKRLGEQGKVVVRALIEINGSASQAQIQASSGYQRLDEKAIQTVLQWRYKPGKRAGAAEAMWFNIPISFVLD